MLLCRRRALRCFILVLLSVQLKVEEAGQVTSCAVDATTAAAGLLPERNFNLAESCLSMKQRLQRLLLQWNSILPLHCLQLVSGRSHSLGCGLHILFKAGEFFVRFREIAALHASR